LKPDLNLVAGLQAGGAPVMWERVMREALPTIRRTVPPGSRVLELGYGDGLLSCYLSRELGWQITGLDIRPEALQAARDNARRFGLENSTGFHCLPPEETRRHEGTYDAVFIKTVLYQASNLIAYGEWLDWISSCLEPRGILINFETGRSNRLVQRYRKLRRREYSDFFLYTPVVEALYGERFDILERRYYGGWSQFTAPWPGLYRLAARLEEAIRPRDAANCFVVSFIGRKRER
jgi:predicted O-methyltransferase YrrM